MNRNQPSQGLESFLLYLPYPYEMPFLYGGKGRHNSNDDDWNNGITQNTTPVTSQRSRLKAPANLSRVMILGRCFIFLLLFQIFLCLGTILPDSANFWAGILVRAITTSFVTFGGYTFINLAQMAAKEEFEAFHTAPHTINALRCNLIGMIHLAPFLGNLDAHLVVILYCGDASLTGLAVDATACNHFIHVSYLIIIFTSLHESNPIRELQEIVVGPDVESVRVCNKINHIRFNLIDVCCG